MVSVTFPSRPQVAPLPEPPAKGASETSSWGFRGVFDLLQPEESAPDAPHAADALSPQNKAEGVDASGPDESSHDVSQDVKADQADARPEAAGQTLLPAAPSPDRMTAGEGVASETLSATETEPKSALPLSDAVPALQAMMILTAPVAAADTATAALPEVAKTAAAPTLMAVQTAANEGPAPVIGQPAPAGPALPLADDSAPPAAAPADDEGQDAGLFILSRQPGTTERNAPLPSGVPAFWAAREVADADPVARDLPDATLPAAAPKDPAAPGPAGMSEFDGAPLLSDGEGTVLDPADDSATQRDAKAVPLSAALQAFVPGPSHSVPLPTLLQSAVPTTLPPQVPAQIATALAGRPERPLEVRLAPTELGGMTVNLLQEGDVLRVVVQADRPETLDLLRRNGEILLEELRLAGFSGAALSFGDGGGAQDRRTSLPARLIPAAELSPPLPPATTQTTRPGQTAQGLDLRL